MGGVDLRFAAGVRGRSCPARYRGRWGTTGPPSPCRPSCRWTWVG